MILTLLPIMATSFLDSAEDNDALINIISGKYAMASCSKRRTKIIKNLAPTYWRRFSGTQDREYLFKETHLLYMRVLPKADCTNRIKVKFKVPLSEYISG